MSKIVDEIIKVYDEEVEKDKMELSALMRSRLINVLGKYADKLIQNEDPSRFTIPDSNWDLVAYKDVSGFFLFQKGKCHPFYCQGLIPGLNYNDPIKIDSVKSLGKYLKILIAKYGY